MNTIHSLPEEIIALISAGEVVERPSYAVKELIENAIDAHAKRISITLIRGGLDSIIVDDDGDGMSSDDLQESWKLHTTSKITTRDDLIRIRTQGFRGEALASIASVADLTIQSRKAHATFGHEIIVKNQKQTSFTTIGMPKGTRVIVEDIFSKVPARQKQRQRPQTELRHCIDVVSLIALANPSIHFVLKHENKMIFDLPAGSRIERISDIYDEELATNLYPIKVVESYVTISGYIAHPSVSTHHRPIQYVTVNNRPVLPALFSTILRNALREILPSDRHPIFFLSCEVPHELVDVNIHPRKEAVSFVSPDTIQSALEHIATEFISKNDLTFQSSLTTNDMRGKITQTLGASLLREAVLPETDTTHLHFSQYHHTYCISQTHDGILIMDQHAAHERVLYEKFSQALRTELQKKRSIILAVPAKMRITPSDVVLIQQHSEIFKKIGFTLSVSEGKKATLHIHAVPYFFADRDPLPIIDELFADLRSDTKIRDSDSLTHTLLTYLACRSAVKAGDKLSPEKMLEIYRDLLACTHRFTCPHGRPTVIEVSQIDLEKMFGRR